LPNFPSAPRTLSVNTSLSTLSIAPT
jgi:hypothetical protein